MTADAFAEAAMALGRMAHPRLARVVAFCRECAERILVLEMAEGEALSAALHCADPAARGVARAPARAAPLSLPQRLQVAADVTSALQHLRAQLQAHEPPRRKERLYSRLLLLPPRAHGAVSAENVIVDGEGRARVIGGEHLRALLVQSQQLQGASSLSPCLEPHVAATSAGDVFSVGVLLLELVTGRRPVGGDPRVIVDPRLGLWAAPEISGSGRVVCREENEVTCAKSGLESCASGASTSTATTAVSGAAGAGTDSTFTRSTLDEGEEEGESAATAVSSYSGVTQSSRRSSAGFAAAGKLFVWTRKSPVVIGKSEGEAAAAARKGAGAGAAAAGAAGLGTARQEAAGGAAKQGAAAGLVSAAVEAACVAAVSGVVELALRCVLPAPAARPSMAQVATAVEMLRLDVQGELVALGAAGSGSAGGSAASAAAAAAAAAGSAGEESQKQEKAVGVGAAAAAGGGAAAEGDGPGTDCRLGDEVTFELSFKQRSPAVDAMAIPAAPPVACTAMPKLHLDSEEEEEDEEDDDSDDEEEDEDEDEEEEEEEEEDRDGDGDAGGSGSDQSDSYECENSQSQSLSAATASATLAVVSESMSGEYGSGAAYGEDEATSGKRRGWFSARADWEGDVTSGEIEEEEEDGEEVRR
ncbi:unnamed protein product [Closterium sp. Yama58-4]|nr:unnamed protein product [Closterium sp. Yama58-4]